MAVLPNHHSEGLEPDVTAALDRFEERFRAAIREPLAELLEVLVARSTAGPAADAAEGRR